MKALITLAYALALAFGASEAWAHAQHEAEHRLMNEVAASSGIPIVVETGKIPAGNAQAHFNAKQRRCEITLGTERAAPHLSKFYEAPLWPRFFAYHETAHCVLYSDQKELAGKANLDAQEQEMLQDFLALHYLEIEEEVSGEAMDNINVTYHEMFSDVLAVMLLRREGAKVSELKFIREMRQATAFGSSHDTVRALDRVFQMEQTPLAMTDMVDLAKRIAIVSALERLSFMKPRGDGNVFLVGPKTVSALKNAYNQSLRGELKTYAYMEADYESLSSMEDYSAVKHSMVLGRDAAKMSEREFLETWIRTKYGLEYGEWLDRAHKLSVKLEGLAIK